MTINFFVPGSPRGKARPRVVSYQGKSHTYTPATTVQYEQQVRAECAAVAGGKSFGERPVRVMIQAMYQLPKRTARTLPTVKPDCDNIAKIICDALNGVAYADDKQVVELEVRKVYAKACPGVWVTISDYGGEK